MIPPFFHGPSPVAKKQEFNTVKHFFPQLTLSTLTVLKNTHLFHSPPYPFWSHKNPSELKYLPIKECKKIMSSSHFFVIVLICSIQYGCATTMVVDGISQWKNPVAQIGDSIVFRHGDQLKLYIFRNEGAFSTCNFTEATLLNKPNSASYTWNLTRPGIYYFSFRNGTSSACQKGHKWAIKVVLPQKTSVAPAAAPKLSPAPVSGGFIPSSPVDKFPILPPQGADSPEGIPGLVPQKGGGIAIIDSNPAVPLPTDAVDSTGTKEPLHASRGDKQVAGGSFLVVHASLFVMFCLML